MPDRLIAAVEDYAHRHPKLRAAILVIVPLVCAFTLAFSVANRVDTERTHGQLCAAVDRANGWGKLVLPIVLDELQHQPALQAKARALATPIQPDGCGK